MEAVDGEDWQALTRPPPNGAGGSVSAIVPGTANRAIRVTSTDGLSADITMQGARAAIGRKKNDQIVYDGGSPFGTTITLRVTAQGVEDHVLVDRAGQEKLVYAVDLGARVAGVRLVEDTIELVDAHGAPRLRMVPPYVVDAHGTGHRADVSLTGCSADSSPAPPWGRAPTPPGSARCFVTVRWNAENAALPMLVDPAWTSTGTMQELRGDHVLVAIPGTARALAAGGYLAASASYLAEASATAEVFDEATKTWAVTGSMTTGRADAVAGWTNDGVLIAGGVSDISFAGNVDALAAAEHWSPVSGKWTTAGAMSQARFLAAGATVNPSVTEDPSADTFIVAGGAGSGPFGGTTGATAAVDVYQSGVGWLAPLTFPQDQLCYFGSIVANLGQGLALVAGCGGTESETAIVTTTTSPPTIVQPSGPPRMNSPHVLGAAVALRPAGVHVPTTAVIVAGGQDAVNALTSASEYFNPATFSWIPLPDLAYPRLSRTSLPAPIPLAGGAIGAFFPMADDSNAGVPATITFAEVLKPAVGSDPAGWGTTDSGWSSPSAPAVQLNDGAVLVAGPGRNPATPACANSDCPFSLLFSTLPPGSTCGGGGDCASGHCVDQVCCNSTCDGTCVACSSTTKTDPDPGKNGICGPALAGSDANGNCPITDACGNDGACDGAGHCRVAGNGDPCGVTACSGGLVSSATCDGAGKCNVTTHPCAPYTGCDPTGAACATYCGAQSDCQPTHYCDSVGVAPTFTCLPKLDQGKACNADAQCSTNACVDGFCCATACSGTCEWCGDPASPGECVIVSGSPKGRSANGSTKTCAIAGGGECAPTCDGSKRDGCTYPGSATTCSVASCNNDAVVLAAGCDGSGHCNTAKTQGCGDYTCENGACKTSCTTSADCKGGATCDASSGVGTCTATGATCADGFKAKATDGTETYCAGYKCIDGSGCQSTCAAGVDCDVGNGYSCTGGLCVTGDAGTAGSGATSSGGAANAGSSGVNAGSPSSNGGGCGCRVPGGSAPDRRALFLGLLAVMAATRSRRRRRDSKIRRHK